MVSNYNNSCSYIFNHIYNYTYIYQIDTLLEKMGVDLFDHYVSKLANFIIKNGASVKGHYSTILKWWTEDSAC